MITGMDQMVGTGKRIHAPCVCVCCGVLVISLNISATSVGF